VEHSNSIDQGVNNQSRQRNRPVRVRHGAQELTLGNRPSTLDLDEIHTRLSWPSPPKKSHSQSSLENGLEFYMPETQFTCPCCSYTSKKRYLLNKHIRKRHPVSSSSTKSFSFPPITTHWQIIIPNSCGDLSDKICDVCSFLFLTRELLIAHIRHYLQTQGPSSAKPFMCPACGKEFKRGNDLRAHMLKPHEKIKEQKAKAKATDRAKPFMCPGCGKEFRRGNDLRAHMQKQHEIMKEEKADKEVEILGL